MTVCNRAVTQNGDYKIIAHISECGNVQYRENKNTMPFYVVKSIENMAAKEKKRYRDNFISLPKDRQYEIILDSLPWSKENYTKTLDELRETYFKNN